jgi:salicylate hydroxylase
MALAAFLAAVPDIRVDIYEAKPEIRTIGAGLAVWKRYWDVLEESLDFNSECEARGIARPRWSEGGCLSSTCTHN